MDNLKYMEKTREVLHRHPELALEEFWTSEFIINELDRFGFKIRSKVGGTGVVGILEFDRSGQTLALRADMDALPVQEETGVAYVSKESGKMHACGHDSHMAILLGICAYASQNKDRLSGKLMTIFQPAEEIVVGAKAMLRDELFADFHPDRFVGIHNWPSLKAGTLGLQSGPITAFADGFKVTFKGQGGHGAFPQRTKDPIAMASAGIQNAFSATQRRTDANFPQTLSFGMIQGGTSFNVIPEEVVVEGTVRTMRPEDQNNMIEILHQAFASGVSLYGGEYELEYRKGVPAVINDDNVVTELTEILKTRLRETEVVSEGLASLIGEDVAYFIQEIPGVLLLIGSGQKGAINELHNSRFLVPKETLHSGYQALVSILDAYLGT